MLRQSVRSILFIRRSNQRGGGGGKTNIYGITGTTPTTTNTSTSCTHSRSYYDDETNKNDDGTSTTTRIHLSDSERALYSIAKPRLEDYRAKHIRMPDLSKIPKASLDVSTVDALNHNKDNDIALMIRRKRLLYRCMQRGWLEVDLLLGTWASQNVMTLTEDELNDFETFVNSETIDIYNIITLRFDTLPEQWKKTSNTTDIVERIQIWAKSNPLGRADPEKYKEIKASAKLI